jgi:hypothetical protein
MDNLAEDCEILEATMCNYQQDVEIKGRCPGWEISVRIVPVEDVEEVNADA